MVRVGCHSRADHDGMGLATSARYPAGVCAFPARALEQIPGKPLKNP